MVYTIANRVCKFMLSSPELRESLFLHSNTDIIQAPVPHPYESQHAGSNGPLLLEDFHLIGLLSHFDRERIPERVVHAKGSGAHGVYKTSNSLEDLCLADMFKEGSVLSLYDSQLLVASPDRTTVPETLGFSL